MSWKRAALNSPRPWLADQKSETIVLRMPDGNIWKHRSEAGEDVLRCSENTGTSDKPPSPPPPPPPPSRFVNHLTHLGDAGKNERA